MSAPSNQFLNGTAKSNYAADTFFRDSLSRLLVMSGTSSVIQIMYDRTVLLYNVWEIRYTEWITKKGNYAGRTNEWEEIATELASVKYQFWRSSLITSGIMPDSSTFKTLMPNGSKYYHGGRYERRTAEVKAFSEQLETLVQNSFSNFQWAVLSELKTDVRNFYTQMTQARNTQQETEKTNNDAPIALENARIDLCIMLYRNLGLLMDIYPDKPEMINSFYDWTQLRSKSKRKNKDSELKITSNNIVSKEEID